MKGAKGQLMSCSNNYRLESTYIKNKKLHTALFYLGISLKFIAVFSLIVLIWLNWFYVISISIYLLSIMIDRIASKMIFQYEYYIDDDKLKVAKILNTNKVLNILNIEISEITDCALIEYTDIDFNSDSCFVPENAKNEIYISFIHKGKTYYLVSDKYFYSLITEKK